MLKNLDRRQLLEKHGVQASAEEYADKLYSRVTKDCSTCGFSAVRNLLANKFLDAKLNFAQNRQAKEEAREHNNRPRF
jgi:hypothetical protein